MRLGFRYSAVGVNFRYQEILEYCHWSVRRSAGVVVRSVLNILWDEVEQTYSSMEFDVRMSSSATNLRAVLWRWRLDVRWFKRQLDTLLKLRHGVC